MMVVLSRLFRMECLYWLVKSEVPHNSLYSSMLQAVEFMGYEKLRHLKLGENAKYTSRRITGVS